MKARGTMDVQDRPGFSEVATYGHFVSGNGRRTVHRGGMSVNRSKPHGECNSNS